jgi:hypothetical protein
VNDAAEVASATANTWFPSSMDFQATAIRSGVASGASSLADMINIIARQPAGSISFLGLIGHAAEGPRTFGFAGRMTTSPPHVVLTPAGFLNAQTIWDNYSLITPLRSKFARDARIVLYACHTGADRSLLSPISNAFGVCVDGFTNPVTWCFKWAKATGIIDASSRGRVFVDAIGLYAARLIECDTFNTDATMLRPEVTSCACRTATTRPLLPEVTWE